MSVTDKHPSQLTAIQKRDWAAAHILYTSNIRASLAGCPPAAFYGSDTLWVQSMLLVNDPDFEDACRVLHTTTRMFQWINATTGCCNRPT